ncbi:MAG TPA: 23S rRNA (guanosine(2251)-2'-O)-methyltransferase RlmB [Nitrospiria bacterium]|nr:23S rRNA (guanosine(2251)-2'-O)-methyltransferase RlmB [Nitrospiria bacterium]
MEKQYGKDKEGHSTVTDRGKENVVIGVRPVTEALRAGGRSFTQIYIQKGRTETGLKELITLARANNVRMTHASREVIDQLAGTLKHQGVVGLGAVKKLDSLDEVLAHAARKGEAPFLFLLDEIEDPRNLGAILRTAEGAGVHGVIIPTRRAAGLTETVAKTSAGAIEYVRIVQVVNLVQTMERLKEDNIWVYGLDGTSDDSYFDHDFRGPIAFVLGGEGKGLRPLVADTCDVKVSIPMRGRISSLNVSNAAAVIGYETVRQRLQKGSSKLKAGGSK